MLAQSVAPGFHPGLASWELCGLRQVVDISVLRFPHLPIGMLGFK